MPRPAAYQAIAKLTARSLVRAEGTERSAVGPTRTIVEITSTGEDRLSRWLAEPVDHVRDLRSLFLLKLALLQRRSRALGPLLDAQRAELVARAATLDAQRAAASEPDRMVVTWRWSIHRAAIAFLDELARDHEPSPAR
jgi:DNA-binding PadR family transcriptional regulator